MSDHPAPLDGQPPSTPADAFDALRADTTPIAPPARFVEQLRQQLVTELDRLSAEEAPMSTTSTATATTPTTASDGVDGVMPYIIVRGAAAAIDFYVHAFGAVEHHRLVGDDGRIGHAEITIGTTQFRLADEYPEYDALGPISRGGTPVNFTVTVRGVDRMFARAIELGATEVRPVADQFYGHRQGTLRDPFGHQWSLSQPIPGFDPEQYVANSAAEGFTVVNAEPPTPSADVEHDQQIKHHVPGDLYYFTLPVQDLARGQRFFSAVLGWRFADPDNGHVGNITAPPGGLNVSGDAGARLWFVVDDIHAAVARVRAAGGTAQEPVFYDSGWSADCVDDQGTMFSLSVPSNAYSR